MASITIRHFDDGLKQKLRLQAALHGCSMEEEVRVILRKALTEQHSIEKSHHFAQRIHQRFAALGGVTLPIEEREPMRVVDNNE
jgi:plasmid stability protein